MNFNYNRRLPANDISPPERPSAPSRPLGVRPQELSDRSAETEALATAGHTQSQTAGIVTSNPDPATLRKTFRPDSLVRQRLEMAMEVTSDPNRLDTVRSDFEALSRSPVSRTYASNSGYSTHDFATLLRSNGQNTDAVLRYVIAHQEGLDHSVSHLYMAAEKKYREAPGFYDSVFSSLIPDAFRRHAEEEAYRSGTNSTAAEDLPVFLRHLAETRQQVTRQGILGFPTGIPRLDNALNGIHGLNLVSGLKGAGKTTLGLSVVREVLKSRRDAAVLMYSLDLPKGKIFSRLLCREADVSFNQLIGRSEMTDEDRRRLHCAKETVAELAARLRVVERDYGYKESHNYESGYRSFKRGLSFNQIANDCTRLLQESGAGQILIFIDMLNKWVIPGDVDPQTDPDQYRLDTLDRVRQWSRAICPDGFVVFATSELRKDSGMELTIDDLKGDGRLASDADTVLLVSPLKKSDDLSDAPVPVNVRIAKTRDGGRRGDIRLMFNHLRYRFEDPPVEPNHVIGRRRRTAPNTDAFGE